MRRIFARPRWWGLGLGLLALVLFFVASIQQAQPATAALGRGDAHGSLPIPPASGRVNAYPGPSDTPAAYPAPATATLPPPGNPIGTATPTATTPAAYPGPSETPGAYPPPATVTETATLAPPEPSETATLVPPYPGVTATLVPPYPGVTATLPAYPGATATLPAYPGPTRTATLPPPPTHTPHPYPYPGATVPPYPGPTATPTQEAQILSCDDGDSTQICHGVVAVKVYIDYQCNRVFNPTVDAPLPNTDVQVRLDDGRTLTGHTDANGETAIQGVQVTRGHPAQVRVGKPTPPSWVVQGGLMLSLCGNSPASLTLTDDSFSTEQRTNVAFRFAVR
ncbi:MAG: hypothetical protein U0822_21860 [Anaerolineae bacterium]